MKSLDSEVSSFFTKTIRKRTRWKSVYCPKITNLVIISLPNYLAFRRIPTQLSFYYLYGCVEQQGKVGVKSAREKKKMPVKILKFLPVKPFFCPWKKNKKCPWKKNTRVKKVKKPEKNGREKQILPVKKTKNRQKKSFTPTFFFTPKKKKHWFTPFLTVSLHFW